MRILITGGAGFIGTNLVRYLLKKYPGYELVVMDRLAYTGNLENLVEVEHLPMFHFVQGDICHEVEVDALMSQGIEAVIHLAAEPYPNPEETDPSRFIRTDLYGTYVLAEAAAAYKVDRFIHISTAEVYGAVMSGDIQRAVAEGDELKPLSARAASRVGADRLAYSYAASAHLPVTILRPSMVYGPYQYPDRGLAEWIASALLGEGIQLPAAGQRRRDWVHVQDVCSAIETILHARKREVEGDVFNVGQGHARSDIEVVELLLHFLDQPRALIQPEESPSLTAAPVDTAALERLGWEHRVDFHQGLAETLQWYQDHRSWWEKLRQPMPENVIHIPSVEDEDF
jgi:dTDP-glucose 4,6-dehydratase